MGGRRPLLARRLQRRAPNSFVAPQRSWLLRARGRLRSLEREHGGLLASLSCSVIWEAQGSAVSEGTKCRVRGCNQSQHVCFFDKKSGHYFLVVILSSNSG